MAVAVGVLLVFAIVGAIIIVASQLRGQDVTINVTVTGGKAMTPSDLSAHQNDTLTIKVSSDMDGEVHLHVYDIALAAKAGETTSHTFKADKTCACDVEWETTSTPLGKLVVSP
jgi:hypothetical protein